MRVKISPWGIPTTTNKSGRMHFVPGKIKYSSSMYKGIKWLLSSIETPTPVIFSKRITEELTNIMENTGASISLKRTYIKDLRTARLNVRRKRFFNKWLKKRRRKWANIKKWKRWIKRKNFYGREIRYKRKVYRVRKKTYKKKKRKFLRLTKRKIQKNLYIQLKKKRNKYPRLRIKNKIKKKRKYRVNWHQVCKYVKIQEKYLKNKVPKPFIIKIKNAQ